MRKLILNLALSLDGYIEGRNGEYDWCFTDQDYGVADFLEQIDALLMGRKTFETLQKSGADPFASKHKYIVSRTLASLPSGATVIADDFINAIRKLKHSAGKDIWLFGGAQLSDALLDEELIDEFQLAIHPLLLGDGRRLFRQRSNRLNLELTDCKQYSSGLVQLFYKPVYKDSP